MSLLSTKLISRLWVAAVVVGLAFGACLLLLYRVGTVEIRPLHKPIAGLPLRILDYTGADVDVRDDVTQQVNAIESVSRKYRNADGVEISLHVAAFTGIGEPTLPHPPTVCYPAAGGRIVAQQSVTEPIVAQMMTVEREELRSYVLYWYAWDDTICTTRSQAAWQRLKMVGRAEWPPAIKVLLEIQIGGPAENPDQALKEFGAAVFDWTKSL